MITILRRVQNPISFLGGGMPTMAGIGRLTIGVFTGRALTTEPEPGNSASNN
jgi:hypothetical protein